MRTKKKSQQFRFFRDCEMDSRKLSIAQQTLLRARELVRKFMPTTRDQLLQSRYQFTSFGQRYFFEALTLQSDDLKVCLKQLKVARNDLSHSRLIERKDLLNVTFPLNSLRNLLLKSPHSTLEEDIQFCLQGIFLRFVTIK